MIAAFDSRSVEEGHGGGRGKRNPDYSYTTPGIRVSIPRSTLTNDYTNRYWTLLSNPATGHELLVLHTRILPSSRLLHGVSLIETDVSGLPIGPET